ncbi:hypothetical protein HYS79_01160 [Patescibacteria group bacterium]|nr:hypothetical protein [Patescibacteria group bacterium]
MLKYTRWEKTAPLPWASGLPMRPGETSRRTPAQSLADAEKLAAEKQRARLREQARRLGEKFDE